MRVFIALCLNIHYYIFFCSIVFYYYTSTITALSLCGVKAAAFIHIIPVSSAHSQCCLRQNSLFCSPLRRIHCLPFILMQYECEKQLPQSEIIHRTKHKATIWVCECFCVILFCLRCVSHMSECITLWSTSCQSTDTQKKKWKSSKGDNLTNARGEFISSARDVR